VGPDVDAQPFHPILCYLDGVKWFKQCGTAPRLVL
jgi:hypothetical protein